METCNYPDCKCPIDKTTICAKGLPEPRCTYDELPETGKSFSESLSTAYRLAYPADYNRVVFGGVGCRCVLWRS